MFYTQLLSTIFANGHLCGCIPCCCVWCTSKIKHWDCRWISTRRSPKNQPLQPFQPKRRSCLGKYGPIWTPKIFGFFYVWMGFKVWFNMVQGIVVLTSLQQIRRVLLKFTFSGARFSRNCVTSKLVFKAVSPEKKKIDLQLLKFQGMTGDQTANSFNCFFRVPANNSIFCWFVHIYTF